MKYHPDELNKGFKKQLQKQHLSEATIRYYISDVRVFLRFIYQISGDYEITSEMFQSYENFLKSGTLPTKTINRKLSSLRIFSTYLIKEGILVDDFMQKVKNNRQNMQQRGFKFSTSLVLLGIFVSVLIIGSIYFSSTNKDIFSISTTTVTTNPVLLPKSLPTDAAHPPELLRSQNITDITVEGTSSVDMVTVSRYGKDSISVGEKSVPITKVTSSGGLMFITPTSPIVGTYFVGEENNTYILHLSEIQKNDFTFNWILVTNQLPIDKLPR